MHLPPKIHNILFIQNLRLLFKLFAGWTSLMRRYTDAPAGVLINKRRDC